MVKLVHKEDDGEENPEDAHDTDQENDNQSPRRRPYALSSSHSVQVNWNMFF